MCWNPPFVFLVVGWRVLRGKWRANLPLVDVSQLSGESVIPLQSHREKAGRAGGEVRGCLGGTAASLLPMVHRTFPEKPAKVVATCVCLVQHPPNGFQRRLRWLFQHLLPD